MVAGAEGKDINTIKSYPFVDYIGMIPHEQILTYMQQSALYIQNSVFETFGIAPLEALLCGCNLLLSCHTGALSIIPGALETDIIYDPYDIDEIANKILTLLHNNNQKRLISSINFDTSSPSYRVYELLTLINSLIT